MSNYYTRGHKPQYGKARWTRYENLRVSGFTWGEARTLSKMDNPDDVAIQKTMSQQRSRMLKQFERIADINGWEGRKRNAEYNKELRSWYAKRGYTSLGGVTSKAPGAKPDIFSLFHDTENRLAIRRGWQKGIYNWRQDQGEKSEDIISDPDYHRRRRKPKSPPRKVAKSRGQVKAQKSRAKARAKASPTGLKVAANTSDLHTRFIIGLTKTAAKSPERDKALTDQAQRLGFQGKSLVEYARKHQKALGNYDDSGNPVK